MKIKMLAILLILCVFVCGCSDERLSQPLEVAFFGEANKISSEGALGPPPPHIQEFLWGGAEGRYENTLNILLQYEQWKELGEGESFKLWWICISMRRLSWQGCGDSTIQNTLMPVVLRSSESLYPGSILLCRM